MSDKVRYTVGLYDSGEQEDNENVNIHFDSDQTSHQKGGDGSIGDPKMDWGFRSSINLALQHNTAQFALKQTVTRPGLNPDFGRLEGVCPLAFLHPVEVY